MNGPTLSASHSSLQFPRPPGEALGVVFPTVDEALARSAVVHAQSFVTLMPSQVEAVAKWVDAMQCMYGRSGTAHPAEACPSIAQFFPDEFLSSVTLFKRPEVARIDWSHMGFPCPHDFILGGQKSSPVPYLALRDSYILRSDRMGELPLHIEALTRVAQWRMLGDKGFLYAFAAERRRAEVEPMFLDAQCKRMGGACADSTQPLKVLEIIAAELDARFSSAQ